uniref:Ell-associated factor Eaf n=1 Tax=Parastrongyloides trichosuri TaxID=131310 RepID=A0A0N4ZEV4_PARTI
MSVNSNCGLPIGVYKVNIGESLLSKDNGMTFHSVRYDFRPASISNGGSEMFLQFSDNNYVNVAVENETNNSLVLYKGSNNKIGNKKECIMLLDPNTNQLTIEKLNSQMRVKYLRNPQEKIVQIIREKVNQKKIDRKDNEETIYNKETTSETCKEEENEIIENDNKIVENTTEDESSEHIIKRSEIENHKSDISSIDDSSSDDNYDYIFDEAVPSSEKNDNNESNKEVINQEEHTDDDLIGFFDNVHNYLDSNVTYTPKKNNQNRNTVEEFEDNLNSDIPRYSPKHVNIKKFPNFDDSIWYDDLNLSEDEDSDDD